MRQTHPHTHGLFAAAVVITVASLTSSSKVMVTVDSEGRVQHQAASGGEAFMVRSDDFLSTSGGEGGSDFKVMTWNILADGLSDDGFVVPLKGNAEIKFPKANAWDTGLKSENPFKSLTAAEELSAASKELVTGSMGAFIADQENIKKVVYDKITKTIGSECDAARGLADGATLEINCCQSKDLMKAIGIKVAESADKKYDTSSSEFTSKDLKSALKKCLKAEKPVKEEEPAIRDITNEEKIAFTEKVMGIAKRNLPSVANAVKRLDQKWTLKIFGDALKETVEWGSTAADEESGDFKLSKEQEGKRGMRLVKKILEENPDILATQENDHYRFFQDQLGEKGYRTTKDGDDSKYTRAVGCGVDLEPGEDAIKKCSEDVTFARVAKITSNAKKFAKDKAVADNDGSCLFWKAERFSAKKIMKTYFGKVTEGGVVGALLADKKDEGKGKCIVAFATHLPSGNKVENEKERLDFVKAVSKWVEDEVSAASEGSDCKSVGVVWMMDGNSYQDFENEKKGLKKEDNMYHAGIEKLLHLQNYEMADDNKDSSELFDADGRSDLPKVMASSVNKIRGVESVQLTKIGEYQLDRIDYIAVSKELQTSKVKLPAFDRSLPRNEEGSPYNQILPSYENPSDHLPVVSTIAWGSSKSDSAAHSSIQPPLSKATLLLLLLLLSAPALLLLRP